MNPYYSIVRNANPCHPWAVSLSVIHKFIGHKNISNHKNVSSRTKNLKLEKTFYFNYVRKT